MMVVNINDITVEKDIPYDVESVETINNKTAKVTFVFVDENDSE